MKSTLGENKLVDHDKKDTLMTIKKILKFSSVLEVMLIFLHTHSEYQMVRQKCVKFLNR